MSSPTRGLSSGQNPSWSLSFWNRVHRYRCLVQKFWWVLVLTLSLCFFAASWYQINRPVTYYSAAALTVDMEHSIVRLSDSGTGGAAMGPDDYMAMEVPVIKSGSVQQMALAGLQTKYPDMLASPVKLGLGRDGAVLTLTAMGSDAEYTQRYLQAIVNAYFANRHKLRNQSSDESFNAIRREIDTVEETLKKDDAAINDFQRSHNVVFDKDDANGANAALAAARQKLDLLRDQYNKLRLMTPQQGLKGSAGTTRQAAGNGGGAQPSPGSLDAGSGAEGDYRAANAELAGLRAQLDDFSRDLRPKHPKIVALKAQIERQEQLKDSLMKMSGDQIEFQRKTTEALIKTAEADVTAAEKKAFEVNVLRSAFEPLREKKSFDLKHYDDLQTTLTKGVSNSTIAADPVRIMEPVSAAEAIPSSWLKMLGLALVAGLASGVGVLALIDRMDDRMGSINDLQHHFSEAVLGQIPRDPETDANHDTELLKPDDPRHQLVESFRNLRSTLLYMPLEGERPKTLLVTSAVPNEGKSTLSCNLALVMAAAGMKTLLIDADLRRGAIHQKFGITRDPGLTDVLGHNVNWKIAIRQTNVENLHVLPRGRNIPQPSEYLLNKNTDRLLQELYPLYDYIIIDSSPVLAADDTSSLAPKIDATLFVVRMGFTSAKMTRKSLEILYGRQANIPGLILNQVDTSSPEFVYYQYSEYYHTATDEDDGGPQSETKEKTKPVKPTVEV